MSARHCYGETVQVWAVGEDGRFGPAELALEIQHLIESLEEYSWVNVDWTVDQDSQYSATVYVHV